MPVERNATHDPAGDTLILSGRAIADGHVPTGFGPRSGTIHPAGSTQ